MTTEYYRGDDRSGITPPDLTKDVSFAEHIVKARGKRTRFTSVSKDRMRIRDFGDAIWRVLRDRLMSDAHEFVEHEALMGALRQVVTAGERADRQKAVLALRYARKRLEGLVDWRFRTDSIERKDLITWAREHVRPYFERCGHD